MPTPLPPEAADVLASLAAPVAFNRQSEFVAEVLVALAGVSQPGAGIVHRVGRSIQRKFTLQAQKETSLASTGPRHDGQRTPILRA